MASTNESSLPTREELAEFYDALAHAKMEAIAGQIPAMEASRKVIMHFLREKMRGFDDVMYFIYEGVKVFEQGKREEAERKEGLTTEQKMHGGKR